MKSPKGMVAERPAGVKVTPAGPFYVTHNQVRASIALASAISEAGTWSGVIDVMNSG